MPLPFLYTVPTSVDELRRFFFWHQADHLEIQQAILKAGVNLPVRVLEPVDLDSITAWDEQHQQTHNEVNGALGLVGQDLGGFNYRNADKLREWVYLNAQEHLAQRSALKI